MLWYLFVIFFFELLALNVREVMSLYEAQHLNDESISIPNEYKMVFKWQNIGHLL